MVITGNRLNEHPRGPSSRVETRVYQVKETIGKLSTFSTSSVTVAKCHKIAVEQLFDKLLVARHQMINFFLVLKDSCRGSC